MKLVRSNRWLLLGAVVLLTPMLVSAKPKKGCGDDAFRGDRNCQQVPEGGSTAAYLLALGATCLGAMVLRSRSDN
jgi:hypothetical protein